MKHPETILDFGSSKIVCIIGETNKDSRFEVYGIADNEYQGIKRGVFLNEVSTMEAAISAINTAMDESKTRVNDVSIGVPGQFLEFAQDEVKIVFDTMHTITQQDIDNLKKLASKNEKPKEQWTRIHMIPVSYRLNEITREGSPINLSAKSVTATFFNIYMKNDFQTFIEGILQQTGLQVKSFYDSTFCEAMLLAKQKVINNLAIIVDVGYYHTDICVLQKMAPIYRKIISVGGANFANDISYVLDIPTTIAEGIKRSHVFSLDYTGRKDTYRSTDGTANEYEYETIQEIIEQRAQELVSMVKSSLKGAQIEIPQETPLFLCGGGLATMRGSREYFQTKIGFVTSTDFPWMPRKNSVKYLSSYGVLKHACSKAQEKENKNKNSIVNAIINFFTK